MLYIDKCKHWIIKAPVKNQEKKIKKRKCTLPGAGFEPVTPGVLAESCSINAYAYWAIPPSTHSRRILYLI